MQNKSRILSSQSLTKVFVFRPFFQPIHFPSCFFKRPALRSHSSAFMYLAIAHAGTIVIGWRSSQGGYLRKLLGQVALCANAAPVVFEVKGLYNLFITQLSNQWLRILPWFFACNKLSDFCSLCWGSKVGGQLCFKTFNLFGNIQSHSLWPWLPLAITCWPKFPIQCNTVLFWDILQNWKNISQHC